MSSVANPFGHPYTPQPNPPVAEQTEVFYSYVPPAPEPGSAARDPADPPVFVLLGSSAFAPWLPDTAYQKVPFGTAGQVLAAGSDGSIGWSSNAPGVIAPSGDTTGAADLAAINSALTATGYVYLQPSGTYYISNSITPPSNAVLDGGHGGIGTAASTARIVATAGFAGTGLIELGTTSEVQIRNLCLDGSQITAGTHYGVNGVSATYVLLLDLLVLGDVNKVNTGLVNGIRQNTSGANPVGWHAERVIVRYAAGTAFLLISGTDATWIDCQSSTSGADGWQMNGCQNSRWIGCRGDRDANNGFHVTGGGWGTGSGSGGGFWIGCSSDRCTQNGFLVDSTGTGPHLITGNQHRRDGSDGNAARCGIRVSGATNPVVITGCGVFPGVEDNGSGNNTPPVGVGVLNSTSVSIVSGYFQAVTTPISNGGGNTSLYIAPGVVKATGSTSAPVIAPNAPAASLVTKPTAPASTVSATLVMMGLGTNATGTPAVITPTGTGLVQVTVTADITTATGAAVITYGGRFGTGAAPVNGAAVTGTRFGAAGDPTTTPNAASVRIPIAFTDIVTLTPGTAAWFDLALATANAADAASVNNVSITLVELTQ